jgi:hypothetical protein
VSSVKDFGAVGDGTTDDTSAIRHAIDQGDGLISFPRGRYRITQTIEVPLDATGFLAFEGSGGTATLVMAGAGPALRLVGTHDRAAHPNEFKPNVWQNQRMPTVRYIEIAADHPEADGIELVGTMQATLEGVLIREMRHGIRLHKRNRNVIIDSCHIYHNRGVGVYLDAVNLHQINIIGNHISYNRLGGIRIERSEVRNLQITGNDIEYNNHRTHDTPPEPTAEITIDTQAEGATVDEVTICSNTIQATVSPGGANLRILERGGRDRPPGLFTITGNIIGSQEVNVHLVGCHGTVLSGNSIYSCGQRALHAEGCDQLSITGNNFRSHDPRMFTGLLLEECRDTVLSACVVSDEFPEGQPTKAPLLELNRCERITVQGCHFVNGTPAGIDATDSSYINVIGCMVVDLRDDVLSEAAIRFKGNGRQNRVSACMIGDAWEEGVQGADSIG